MTENPHMTSPDIRSLYGVSDGTITRRITAGELHPVRDPRNRRRYLFDREEVAAVFTTPTAA